jgi:hypothetical protein
MNGMRVPFASGTPLQLMQDKRFNTGTAPGITKARADYNTGVALGNAGTEVGKAMMTDFRKPVKTSINWQDTVSNLSKGAKDIAPYASNIANLFAKPARPQMGAMMDSVRLAAPNYDATRADINASESAMNRNLDQTLDASTAAAAKLGARGQTLGSMSRLAEQENNAKASVANQQAQMNMHVNANNVNTINDYRNSMTDYANTAKSAVSANIANAGDKYIDSVNMDKYVDLEKQNRATIQAGYDKGVVTRADARVAGVNPFATTTPNAVVAPANYRGGLGIQLPRTRRDVAPAPQTFTGRAKPLQFTAGGTLAPNQTLKALTKRRK